MVTYLLKKSYQLNSLEEIDFQDLWGDHGVFTTMWIYGSPPKILFFKEHIKNLLKSLKQYKIYKKSIHKDIYHLIKIKINTKKNYNHLLRVALNKKMISISLRKKIKTKLKFNLKLINYKRVEPKYKNLKYRLILKHLSKMDNSCSDIALCFNKNILESGTSNILFIKKRKIYSALNGIYKGITYNFFKKKIGKIINRNIKLETLKDYDEIILIGSGKGVTSVQSINEIKWKRKSLRFYKILLDLYNKEIKRCTIY